MAKSRPKRRHHVNPAFYLRAFQIEDEEEFIWRYDSTSGEALKLHINDAAVRRDYYSHVNPDGLRDTEFVENFLADIEGHTAPVFKKILAGEELSNEEWMTFAYFVALSWLRSPAVRRQTAELLGGMIKTMAVANAADPEHFRSSCRQMEKDKRTKEQDRMSDEEIERARVFILGNEYQISIAEQMTLLPLMHMTDLAETICQMKWTFAEASKETDFITSDSPVVREIPPKYRHPMMGSGFRNKFVEISLPLSPTLCWIGTWNEDMSDVIVASKNQVKSLNRLRAIHAERYLYASTYQEGLSKLAVAHHGPGAQFVMTGFGFKGEPMSVKQFKSKSRGIAPPQAARKKPSPPNKKRGPKPE